MWPDAHQHMCMNEDGKSGVGSSRVGAYSMFGQFNDLPRSEARNRASKVSTDTEGGAAASSNSLLLRASNSMVRLDGGGLLTLHLCTPATEG